MKFARYIAALERDAPGQWQNKFLRYKMLKKHLKQCVLPDGSVSTTKEDLFFEDLQKQLVYINRNFRREALRTVEAFIRSTKGFEIGCCFLPLWRRGPITREYAAVADRAYWCRKYARANAVALRKILKKHDKLCKNDRGRVFLQQCWCSTSADGIGLFLHSPLLDELKAVQDVLQQKLDAEFEENQEIQQHEVDDEEIVTAGASQNVPVKGEISGKKRSADAAVHRPQHHDTEELCDKSESSESIFGSIAEETCDDFVSPLKTAAVSRPGHDAPPSIGRGSPSLMSDGGDRSSYQLSGSPTDGHHGFFPSTTSQSSDGLRGALAASHSGTVSFRSLTSPSLKAQRAAALAAIAESPHLRMLSSSDLEWADLSAEHSATGGDVDPDAPTPSAPRSRVASSTISTNLERFSNDPGRSTEEMLPSGVEARPGGESRQSVVGASSPAVPDGGSSGVGPAVGPFQDDELRCPVCLEIMYKPVGLGCGHKFCKPCALEAAGFGKCFGSFQNIASYVPSRTPCPTCRQKNVYQSAVSLREVGALIQKRFPEIWAERREAEKHKFSDDETLSVPRRTRLRGASPFEILSTTSSMDIVSE